MLHMIHHAVQALNSVYTVQFECSVTRVVSSRSVQSAILSMYCIQHCSSAVPSDFAMSEDAGIEPRTVATLTLTI
jgi:hypothetical protein